MTDLTLRFQQWADELVDLSGRNDLISFRETKTSTVIPREDSVRKLLSGESLLIGQIVDLEVAESKKAATGLIRDAIEFDEQQGIEVLKLVSGFVSWKSDTISNANAPLFLYSLLVENLGVPIGKIKVKLADEEPELNPVLLLHLKRRLGVEIDQEILEEHLGDGEDMTWEALLRQCPVELDLNRRTGFAIKNLRYQKLPMVNDLLSSGESLAKNELIAALAGDEKSRISLRDNISVASRDEPDFTPPDQEYLVLDSDSSQQWAINSALKGQNLVIEGPPGTGKSQTIANLIASYMATGKTVLFVAEKRAAIDAVKKRIDSVGLGDCFFDLHSAETVRKRPAEPFIKALEEIASIPPIDSTNNIVNLSSARTKLVDRTKAVLERRSPWNCSYLDVLQKAIESGALDASAFSISSGEVNAINLTSLSDLQRAVDELISLSAADILSTASPFTKSLRQGRLSKSSDVHSVVGVISDFRTAVNRLSEWTTFIFNQSSDKDVVPLLATVSNIVDILDSLDHINSKDVSIEERHANSLDNSSLSDLRQILLRNKFTRIFHFLVDKRYRKSLQVLKSILSNGVPATATTLRSACRSLRALKKLKTLDFPLKIRDYPSDLRHHISILESSVSVINRFVDRLESMDSTIDSLAKLTGQLDSLRLSLPNAPRISRLLLDLQQLGLQDNGLLEQVIDSLCGNQDANHIAASVSYAWSERVEELIRISDPSLASSTRQFLDSTVATYRQSDRIHIQTSGARIRRICAERAHKQRITYPQQVDILRHESIRKRNRKSARKLFAEIPELLKSLKPCWAMSPLVVSELLPAEPYFDVVIFDEASQIVPHEAITSILRGNQVVVAGDSKQLSPTTTSFFARRGVAAPVSADDGNAFLIEETESLMTAISHIIPSSVRDLLWHYRSEDERLIAFSNRHPKLYGSRLISAPSVSDRPPFEFHHVTGDFTQITGKSPFLEVKRTVDLAITHLREFPDESLAVITLGLPHAVAIEKEFYSRVASLSEIRLAPEFRPEEKFVIRHLESIQGDERDVVILSTGYGPRSPGVLNRAFGPINIDEPNDFGLRRLNVAITRARKCMKIVTTIDPYLYDDNKLEKVGLKAFIQYLRYVKSGGVDLGDLSTKTTPMNPFERDIHDSLVAAGLCLVPQYGVSGYRLDFAVQDPDAPGRYVLAIEADGASYHSTDTARDRDRIRQSHLERLGWRFHRIWSTEWFRNKESEIQLALSAFRDAVSSRNLPDTPSRQVQELPDSFSGVSRMGVKPSMPSYQSIDDYRGEISSFIIWYCSDGVLRSDDDIFNAVFEELPFGRRGRRIVDRLYAEIRGLRECGRIN